jgi:hypothetical protein
MTEAIDEEYINTIFENVRKDTSLLATINIEELLKNIEKNSYLENKTLDDLLEEKMKVLNKLPTTKERKKELCYKLTDYRFVDNIYEVHKGKHIRWIRKGENPTLTNGSPVSDIIFSDNGTNIQCRGYQGRIFQIKWDNCFIFQKLSTGEQLILMIHEHINK